MASKKTGASKKKKGKRPVKDPPTVAPKKSPGRGTSARARGVTVADYLATLPADQLEIAHRIGDIVTKAAPTVTSTLKWGQPIWELSGPLAFLRGSKKHVTFGFWRGAEHDDPKGLLEGSGSKMRHMKIENVERLDATAVSEFVRQAAALNQTEGDPTKRE